MKIGFIGAGNMAGAIIGGMVKNKIYQPEDIIASRRNEAALQKLKEEYGILVTADNKEVMKEADVVFLAVKPQMFPGVIAEIKDHVREQQLFVSIAAGKNMEWIMAEFGCRIKLVRSMPNTPAMVGEGCTGFCGNEFVTEEELRLVKGIFDSCGTSYQVTENLMDVVGAVAGSAPAYVFMFMEAMADAAVAGGMPREMAYKMAAQTVLGSGKLMLETGKHPGVLKDMVCSPAGTTIGGVKVLEKQGMRSAVMEALDSCIQRSRKL